MQYITTFTKKMCQLYDPFSWLIIIIYVFYGLILNNTHSTICYSLVNNQLVTVSKGITDDIFTLDTSKHNIDFKVNYDLTLHNITECEYQ